jgi:hypothetical protein
LHPTTTTQITRRFLPPLRLGQPPTALLLHLVVLYVTAELQRRMFFTAGQFPCLRCLHPAAPMWLLSASIEHYRVAVTSAVASAPCLDKGNRALRFGCSLPQPLATEEEVGEPAHLRYRKVPATLCFDVVFAWVIKGYSATAAAVCPSAPERGTRSRWARCR